MTNEQSQNVKGGIKSIRSHRYDRIHKKRGALNAYICTQGGCGKEKKIGQWPSTLEHDH